MSGSYDVGDRGDHGGTLLIAGEVAAGELCLSRAVTATVLYFCATYMWGPLTGGSQASVIQTSEASSFIQFLNAICKICISSLVDPNGVILNFVESQ